jgi:hypothetical protein
MILRRFAQALNEQNWTAITIEFVLLVLGVFLGIQVANWNQALADRRVADKYLADITGDIRSDISELASTRASALDRIGASSYILRQAGASALVPDLELNPTTNAALAGFDHMTIPDVAAPAVERRNRLWSLTTDIYMYDANRSAYDALVSSGKIDLINDERVKVVLREYYYLVNALSATQLRTLAPLRDQVIATGLARGHSHLGLTDERALVEQVGKDPAFAASVATSRELAATHLLICLALEKKAHEALRLLEAGRS